MKKFTKKPPTIDMVLWDGTNETEVAALFGTDKPDKSGWVAYRRPGDNALVLASLFGTHPLAIVLDSFVGEWIGTDDASGTFLHLADVNGAPAGYSPS